MDRGRLGLIATLLALLSGCVEVPRPARQSAALVDASFVSELTSDASLVRPATAPAYAGPEGAPTAQAPRADAGSSQRPGADLARSTGGRGEITSKAGAGSPSLALDAGATRRDGSAGIDATGGAAGPSAPPGPRHPQRGEVVITEIMSNPEAVADTEGEWIELYNPSPSEALSLDGCAVDDGAKSSHALPAMRLIAAGGYLTIARGAAAGFASDVVLPLSLANSSDAVALVCAGIEIDRVAYGAGFPLAAGASMSLDPLASDALQNDDASRWCLGRETYGGGADRGTPGAPNPACSARDLDAGDAG